MTATSKDKSHQMDMDGLAIIADDIQVDNLYLGGNALSGTELGYVDGITPGTVTASKAVVVDANKDIATFRHVTLSGNLVTGTTTLDETDLAKIDGITNGTTTASKALVVGTTKNLDFLQFGTTAIAALVTGAGTSATPYAMGTTAGKNLVAYYGDTTATSGDTRLMYGQLKFSGAGVSGEAVRFKGTVNNVSVATGGTVNGAHISLEITGASGAVSGAGHALRATLDLGALNNPGGTLDVIQADSNFAADCTVPATTAFLSFDNVGTKKIDYLFRTANSSTTMLAAAGTGGTSAGVSTGGVASKVLKVNIDGTDYWLPLFVSNA